MNISISDFDFDKVVAIADFEFEKKGIVDIPALRVGDAYDISGSTKDMYTKSNVIHLMAARSFAICSKFDKDETLDVWAFDNDVSRLPEMTKSNYKNYITDNIINNSSLSKWSGTEFDEIIKEAIAAWYKKDSVVTETKKSGFLGKLGFTDKKVSEGVIKDNTPTLLRIYTDGDLFSKSEERQCEDAINFAKSYNMYILFVGFGTQANFKFVKKMASEHSNVGFTNLEELSDLSDEEAIKRLIPDELISWLKKQ